MNVNSVGNKIASCSAYIIVSPDLWHVRLGHVNYSYLKNMTDLGLISKTDFKSNFCEICVQSKYSRKPSKV